jgi:hypothetical protein
MSVAERENVVYRIIELYGERWYTIVIKISVRKWKYPKMEMSVGHRHAVCHYHTALVSRILIIDLNLLLMYDYSSRGEHRKESEDMIYPILATHCVSQMNPKDGIL